MKHNYPVGKMGRVISQNETSVLVQRKGMKGQTFDRSEARDLRSALGIWLAAGEPPAGKEDKVAVMIGDTRPPTVILAMSQASWDYCKDGRTHTFDLTKAGLPFQIIIAGGATREGIIADIETAMDQSGGVLDRGPKADRDLGIDTPKPN